MNSLNNRGFTLVELLAVLVVLVAILGIAMPSISSTMERSKDKQTDAIKSELLSVAKVYVSDHKGNITTSCYIKLSSLTDGGYITEEELEDADGNELVGIIEYNSSDDSYSFVDSSSYDECTAFSYTDTE